MTSRLSCLLSLLAVLAIAPSRSANGSECASADTVYADFLHRFWSGTMEAGHLMIITQDANVTGVPKEVLPIKAWLWQYAEGWNPIYTYWKVTYSDEPKSRLAAEWSWVKSRWSEKDLESCGNVQNTSATTQDDSAWVVMGLVQLYEVTNDPVAETYAHAAIKCAYSRWADNRLGGGLWYDDLKQRGKQITNGNFALALMALHDLTCKRSNCDDTLLRRALHINKWADGALRRADGLYWMAVQADGHPKDLGRPYDINLGRSVTSLFGNMGFAALLSRIDAFKNEGNYKEAYETTVKAILKYETRGGAFLDDRDARGNGYAAWDFVHEVIPKLEDPGPAKNAVEATGRGVFRYDRGREGSYGGDWGGPVDGTWASLGFHRDRLEISANAIVWPIVACETQKTGR